MPQRFNRAEVLASGGGDVEAAGDVILRNRPKLLAPDRLALIDCGMSASCL
jgi:hypothetical protein